MTAGDDTDGMWLANLHDVLVNANFIRSLMELGPVPEGPG